MWSRFLRGDAAPVDSSVSAPGVPLATRLKTRVHEDFSVPRPLQGGGAGAGASSRPGLGAPGRGAGVANSPNWMCTSCTNRNYMHRPSCNKCQQPRPAEYATHPDAQRGPQHDSATDEAKLYIGSLPTNWRDHPAGIENGTEFSVAGKLL